MYFAMATLGLKEIRNFHRKGREKSVSSWLSQFSFAKETAKRADLSPHLPKKNFPISFKPKVAIEFFWKMQRKTWRKGKPKEKNCELNWVVSNGKWQQHLPQVPFIYYVRTCIAQIVIWLSNFSQNWIFSSKQKSLFFNITVWQNLHALV